MVQARATREDPSPVPLAVPCAVPSAVPFADIAASAREVADEIDLAWYQIINTASFIGGAIVDRFEEQWARFIGTREAIGVANGTDALELTLRALGIGAGDEVIVPTNTFIATAEAVALTGARPSFVDVDPQTLLATPETIAAAITPRTTAIIAVHLYGNVPDMDAIRKLADTRGLALIEDAAQAHGSTWRGKRAGSFGVAGCFSFYPGKNLGAFGDAGAIVTNDPALAALLRSSSNHGRDPDSNHVHSVLGRNSRLDALQAAVLWAKLPLLEGWNSSRREAVATYRRFLRLHGLDVVGTDAKGKSTYHLCVVRVPDRDRVRAGLAVDGIETRIHYSTPCHLQAAFKRFASEPLPVAEQAASEVVSLPLFPHMAHEQIERVCESLIGLVGGDVREG